MRTFSVIFLLFLLSVVSCSKDKCANSDSEECKITEVQKIGFFNITYETIASRPISTTPTQWIDVSGCREMKLGTKTSVKDDEALPESLTGDFTVALQNFKRTLSSGSCTGGNTGNFTLTFQDLEAADSVPEEDKPPYSIFDPYNNVNRVNNNDEEVNSDPENEIRTYIFGMAPTRESMQPTESCGGQIYCPNSVNEPGGVNQDTKPCSYSFKVVRFPNGHLILDDTSKGVQYYLKPRLSSDTASKCIQSNIPK